MIQKINDMTENNFFDTKKIHDQIEMTRNKIKVIDNLINDNKIDCYVSNENSSNCLIRKYYVLNLENIIDLLNKERTILIAELNKLEETFHNI